MVKNIDNLEKLLDLLCWKSFYFSFWFLCENSTGEEYFLMENTDQKYRKLLNIIFWIRTNLNEVNMKVPINFNMHKVKDFVEKPAIAQHLPEFHSVPFKICF